MERVLRRVTPGPVSAQEFSLILFRAFFADPDDGRT